MKFSRVKVIWDTNRTGILFLVAALVFEIWATYCDSNSFTWQLQTSLRSTCQSLWLWIWEDIFKKDDLLLHTLGTTVWVIISFVLINTVFLVVDVTGCPKWFTKYRVQTAKNNPIDRAKLWDCLKVDARNLCLVNFLFNIATYPISSYIGALHTGSLPTGGWLVLQLWGFRIAEEFGTYYSHRLLHVPQLYKYHKKHHEWTAPVGVVSLYCDKLEHVFGNIAPVALGPFIFRCHLLVGWLWSSIMIATAVLEHVGYQLPFFPSPQGHDYHHKTFSCWYGTMAFLDVFHGTDVPFRNSVHGKRQYISCSLTPVHELVKEERQH